jgi:hydroxyisourate hydrolase
VARRAGVLLMRFDDLAEDDARALLLRCLSAPAWAERVLSGRPYGTAQRLIDAADHAARELSMDDVEAALAGHPRIGERAGAGHNAAASAREQGGVVSTSSTDDSERLLAGNQAYEERFGHVFLIRAAGRSGPEILAELERRLGNPPEVEREEAADNLREIALLRLENEVKPMSSLSTHVLDTAQGRPAAGVPVELRDASGASLDDGITDADGRVASLGGDLPAGTYTLRFAVAAYLPGGFYPEVSVTFVVAPGESHYHVPLLLSPYGYSTYRGS